MTTTVLARDTARIPVLPVAVKRAVDDWLVRGIKVELVMPDGTTLRMTPPTPQDDMDAIDFTPRRRK
jgi:hypothetical protein